MNVPLISLTLLLISQSMKKNPLFTTPIQLFKTNHSPSINPYVIRLSVFDRFYYERAFDFFDTSSYLTINEEESLFLLAALDSGKHFEESTVRNAIDFVRSWADLGHLPDCQVLSRILYLSFLSHKFGNQLICLSEIIPSSDWIFRGLNKIAIQDFPTFSHSIEVDFPIWSFLTDKLFENAISKQIDYTLEYSDRTEECVFLIEGILFGWPCEIVSSVTYSVLTETFTRFCVKCQSTTAIKLLDVLCWVFPKNVGPIVMSMIEKLQPVVICLLLKLDLIPLEMQIGKEFGMKVLKFSQKIGREAVMADKDEKGKMAALELIERFREESNQIELT
jgi:hypothetical protein